MTGRADAPGAEPVPEADAPDWAVDVPLALSLLFLPWARGLVSACWIALAAVLGYRALRGKLRLPREILLGVLCYLVTWGVSLLGSRDPSLSLRDWLGRVGATIPLVAILGRRGSAPMRPMLRWAWVVTTLVLGAWLLGEMLTGHRWLSGTFYPGLSYPMLPNPNGAAQFSLLLFAWTFALALDPREPMPRAARWGVWALPVALLAAGGSRASWPAFAGVALFLSWRRRKPIMGAAALALFVSCNLLFPHTLWNRAVQLTHFQDISFIGRLQGWETALRMVAERAFSGEGLGTWKLAYAQMRLPGYWPDWPHAHNFYLNTLAETGFFGLGGFVAFMLSFRRLWAAGLKSPSAGGAEQALTATLLGFGLVGLLDVTFWGEPGYAFLALTCLAWRQGASLTHLKAG